MKIDQKLRDVAKNKKRKEEKKPTRLTQEYVWVAQHKRNSDNKEKYFVNIEIVEHNKTIKKNRVSEYISLFQMLEDAKKENKYIKKMDTKLVPYEIPEFYSLQKDIEDIALIRKKIDVLNQKICRKDTESLISDWKKVGRDLNEAICKSRRMYADESD